jgi:perosamine synthetase
VKRIPVAGPWITEREIQYVSDAVANAWYDKHNAYHSRLEAAFASYLGVAHAMALPSCTSAIHLALLARNVGPGDEVIVPDCTWIATAAPVIYVGATPVFADIDRQTWCLDAASFEACITARTKAVIPVDLYGGMPDWAAISSVAADHGIFVIEDAAEAIGSMHRGKLAGSLGEVGTFSFHGSKTVTTGEGGLLATNDGKLFARAQVLRDHGRPPGDRFFLNGEVAFKYKMSNLQAALGLAQVERIQELVDRKREIFGWYREHLSDLTGITLNGEPPGSRNSYWMTTIILARDHRLSKYQLMDALDVRGIDSRPFFSPLSSLEAFANQPATVDAKVRNVVSYDIAARGVNLPSALNLTEDDVRRVCDALREILDR